VTRRSSPKVTKADLDRVIDAMRAMGLVPVSVEVLPGMVRFLMQSGEVMLPSADEELAQFRESHGYGED
jgi:hypothetical protein